MYITSQYQIKVSDGRLTKDPSRGIANIVYNEIGMPQKVLFNNGAYIGYVYLANGKKVEQKTAAAPLTLGQFSRVAPVYTIYDEAFEISLGTIQRLNVPGGYVTPRDSVFHLYVPDYQGNNVAVINTETGQAEQLTDYYPYGQPINNGLGASVNPYKYGSKELLTANGYNASDFAARWFSHSLPGFQSPDPLAHETPWLSMYMYCGGDPINLIDPTGCRPVFSRQAVLIGVTDEGGLQGDYIVVDKNSYKLGMSTDDVMKQSISKNDLSSSEIKRIEYAQSTLKNRPDYDGGLTHAEARDWYRKGTGSPLYVNLKTLDLSNVEPHGDSKVGEKVVVNMFWQSSNKDDQLVYGNITLKRYPNNSVRAFSDKYDFDLKSWDSPTNIIRNILTVCGEIVVGKGVSFQIHFYGTATLTNEKETKK